MTSTSAPFATENSGGDEQGARAGRRIYGAQSQRQEAPFATGFPDIRDDVDGSTPNKRPGRRRFEDQDALHESPFAQSTDESPDQKQEPKKEEELATNNTTPARPKPIKPIDNSAVFRYGEESSADSEKAGRRRYAHQDQRTDAPFATNEAEDIRDGAETPRSAGGRRRFDEKLQQKPAPFAMDDGTQQDRFKNVSAKTDCHRQPEQTNGNSAAGMKQIGRHVPPPNSSGEGVNNRSKLDNCPFALN